MIIEIMRTLESLGDERKDDTDVHLFVCILVEHFLQTERLGTRGGDAVQDLSSFYVVESHEGCGGYPSVGRTE